MKINSKLGPKNPNKQKLSKHNLPDHENQTPSQNVFSSQLPQNNLQTYNHSKSRSKWIKSTSKSEIWAAQTVGGTLLTTKTSWGCGLNTRVARSSLSITKCRERAPLLKWTKLQSTSKNIKHTKSLPPWKRIWSLGIKSRNKDLRSTGWQRSNNSLKS